MNDPVVVPGEDSHVKCSLLVLHPGPLSFTSEPCLHFNRRTRIKIVDVYILQHNNIVRAKCKSGVINPFLRVVIIYVFIQKSISFGSIISWSFSVRYIDISLHDNLGKIVGLCLSQRRA